MANQINKDLAAELKNFNKDELTETKTSENIVTPVTGEKSLFFDTQKTFQRSPAKKSSSSWASFPKPSWITLKLSKRTTCPVLMIWNSVKNKFWFYVKMVTKIVCVRVN